MAADEIEAGVRLPVGTTRAQAAAVANRLTEETLALLKRHATTAQACVIGEVGTETDGEVSARTALSTVRRLVAPSGEQLPRIC